MEDWAQINDIAEVEVVFHSDKTHNFGQGTARSFFAINNTQDERCVVRDLGRLWLMSERVTSFPTFSWDNGTKGVVRHRVIQALKYAAVLEGIPAADIASHSLRITGLSRLLSAGMSFRSAVTFGRWRSDCALRYYWPSTSLAKEYAEAMWLSPSYARVRSGGAIQRLC